jgi:hypothetical protein
MRSPSKTRSARKTTTGDCAPAITVSNNTEHATPGARHEARGTVSMAA